MSTRKEKEKEKKYIPKSFESAGHYYKDIDHKNPQAETHAGIYETMLRSRAFQDLGYRERCLYLVCKAQYYGKTKPEKEHDIDAFKGPDKFYLNWHQVQKYGMYKPTMSSRFYKDMQTLIDHGLIERVASGKVQREKTVYKYSDKWQTWSG